MALDRPLWGKPDTQGLSRAHNSCEGLRAAPPGWGLSCDQPLPASRGNQTHCWGVQGAGRRRRRTSSGTLEWGSGASLSSSSLLMHPGFRFMHPRQAPCLWKPHHL